MTGDLKMLQGRIRYVFRDPAHLARALTHASWVQDNPGGGGNNQRLEFLGDSVLQLILTEALFALFPEDREGELSKRRAILGKGEFLSGLAREIGLDRCLRLGANEEATGGRARDAALEDAFDLEFPDRMLTRGVFESVGAIGDAIAELTPSADGDLPLNGGGA